MSSKWLSRAHKMITICITLVFFLPLYLVLVNIFKENDKIMADPLGFPTRFTLENLKGILTRPDHLLFTSMWNSVVITAISLLVIIVSSSMVAYYLVRNDSKKTRLLLLFFLFGLMVPTTIILIPVVKVLMAAHLMSSKIGLIVFYMGYYVPFGIFMYSGFIRTIPRELDEAASIDGSGPLRTFWKIIFPLLGPCTSSVIIFIGLWVWNDFLNPLIIIGPIKGTTITAGIYRVIGQFSINWGQMFSMMFLASLPIIVLYLALQKQFVEGITSGSLKG
ncbi:carbohydrate ABC transporter permease [Paenibacillus sp. KQZ6P-2]|uniref:Carbohydrate ABC transporter permease n=1 Tax=Paenibacillus mangrovi TaxID=2931978 RepID=A0A9X2B238_9BACL|nr:carbohydrate ABC transporter permease [Paenibacillus mangrovi]MCJ8011520.1 carbohydrate ABC transporter permease [Paenibacillus mangrovi]